jgi:hypothetical protein
MHIGERPVVLGFAPWRYVRFFDYAEQRIFLPKVGDRYIFKHRLLQDHIAAMWRPGFRVKALGFSRHELAFCRVFH